MDFLERIQLDPAEAAAATRVGAAEVWRAYGFEARRRVEEDDSNAIATAVREVLARAPLPIAQAMEAVEGRDREVVVRFRQPDSLAPREVEGRSVECLLYEAGNEVARVL